MHIRSSDRISISYRVAYEQAGTRRVRTSRVTSARPVSPMILRDCPMTKLNNWQRGSNCTATNTPTRANLWAGERSKIKALVSGVVEHLRSIYQN